MFSFYNKKLGWYKTYYNSVFFSYILPYSNTLDSLYNKHSIESCLIIYPILYKKLSFFKFSVQILNKKRIKNRLNLNQTVILEGSISTNKCSLSVPIFSFLNKLVF